MSGRYTSTIATLRKDYDKLISEANSLYEQAKKILAVMEGLSELDAPAPRTNLFEAAGLPLTSEVEPLGGPYAELSAAQAILKHLKDSKGQAFTIPQLFDAMVLGGLKFTAPESQRLRGLSRTIWHLFRNNHIQKDAQDRFYYL